MSRALPASRSHSRIVRSYEPETKPSPVGPAASAEGTAEAKSRLTPVAPHDSSNVTLVYLRRAVEISDIERVQVVILRSKEQHRR